MWVADEEQEAMRDLHAREDLKSIELKARQRLGAFGPTSLSLAPDVAGGGRGDSRLGNLPPSTRSVAPEGEGWLAHHPSFVAVPLAMWGDGNVLRGLHDVNLRSSSYSLA